MVLFGNKSNFKAIERTSRMNVTTEQKGTQLQNTQPTTQNTGKEMMAESKFYMGYSRWDEQKNRYETWEESVERVMQMHRTKYTIWLLTPNSSVGLSFAKL